MSNISWRMEKWNAFRLFKKREKVGAENCKLSMKKYWKIIKLFVSS